PAAGEPPPWISDLVEEAAPQDEASPSSADEQSDDVLSFFDSLETPLLSDEEDETPDIDWFVEQMPDEPETTDGAPADETSDDEMPDWFTESADDTPDDFEEAKHEDDVEIPQNELDAFFSNLAATRTATRDDMEAIEDPDLDWFVSSETGDEPDD